MVHWLTQNWCICIACNNDRKIFYTHHVLFASGFLSPFLLLETFGPPWNILFPFWIALKQLAICLIWKGVQANISAEIIDPPLLSLNSAGNSTYSKVLCTNPNESRCNQPTTQFVSPNQLDTNYDLTSHTITDRHWSCNKIFGPKAN